MVGKGVPELASIQWHRSEIKVETLAGVFFQAASQGNKKGSPAGGRTGGPQEHVCYILPQLGSLRAREVERASHPRISPIWNVINEPRMRETLTKFAGSSGEGGALDGVAAQRWCRCCQCCQALKGSRGMGKHEPYVYTFGRVNDSYLQGAFLEGFQETV